MRHITIKQATEGDTGYYEARVDFGASIERGAKRHLEEMLCMLDWVFGKDFTYSVELANIPMKDRLRCSDQDFLKVCDSNKAKAAEIRQRCSR
jgi:hypothetical protein